MTSQSERQAKSQADASRRSELLQGLRAKVVQPPP
jgi:hypothetical protein